MVGAIRAAVLDANVDALRPVLHPDVTWTSCRGADAVVAMFDSMLRSGLRAASVAIAELEDRVVVTIEGNDDGRTFDAHLAVFDADGRIRHIVDAQDATTAHTVSAPSEPAPIAQTAHAARIAPIFVVGDLSNATGHYAALGFDVEAYEGDAAYGFAKRGEIEIHLAQHDVDPLTNTSAAYLYVDDAAALHREWLASGTTGRFVEPVPTEYGLLEGAHLDPWGNLIRYGSPLG